MKKKMLEGGRESVCLSEYKEVKPPPAPSLKILSVGSDDHQKNVVTWNFKAIKLHNFLGH